jgi:hypothetical protein|tara:strand:- start:23 stop:772 length:750 start_codon:yes stop_codon:yes gene_type:complete
MGLAKHIKVKVIPSKVANLFVKKHHYSGKVVRHSSLHFGAFLEGRLHGVMSFGSPLDKRKVLGLAVDQDGNPCKWNEMLELNRMAFDDSLPKNSESRCIAIAIRLLKKNAPHIRWILSFADGTQCGDGTIYRASGFSLTGIKTNQNTCLLPSGDVMHKMTLESNPTSPRKELGGQSYYKLTGGRYNFKQYVEKVDGKILVGFQLRYIKTIDRSYRLAVPKIPFSEIGARGATMYKGVRPTDAGHVHSPA